MIPFKTRLAAIAVTLFALTSTAHAADFSFSFEWGDLKKCNNGRPNRVQNPVFKLKNVPKDTAVIQFQMIDLAVPGYRHGGGKAKYSGKPTIAPGAFKYKSPCPPGGRHTYEWTATAKSAKGKKLATARARRAYP